MKFSSSKLLVFYFHLFLGLTVSFAGENGEESETLDTTAGYPTIELINTLQDNKDAFSNNHLVRIIDSLLEHDSVSYDYFCYLNGCIKKQIYLKEVASREAAYPGISYYSTWDNKTFFNNSDLLKKDTVVELVLTDSIHNLYTHPCSGPVTSHFGWRNNALHNGIDVDLNKGDKVYAAFDGMVRVARRNSSYGNVVLIRHYNGLETLYAHLSKISVKEGQRINSGDILGLGGSTGKSTGSHLHFEVRFKGVAINPSNLISFKEFKLQIDSMMIRKNKWGAYAYPVNASFHTVKRGDTLFGIAKNYGLSVSFLRELNGFSRNAYLRVGQKIRIT